MSDARLKFAVIAASAVVIALLAAAAAFNAFIGWKVETDAANDIEYALELDDAAVTTGRSPNYLMLDSSYRVDTLLSWRGDEDGTKLAEWFSEHPEQGVVRHVAIGEWACYAAIVSADEYVSVEEGYYETTAWDASSEIPGGYYIAYIDVTSERSLIAAVNTAFAIIGIAGALLAALAGFFAGRRVDEAHQAQKRFYENMSHDLKTPLAAIRGYAEGVLGNVVEPDEAAGAIIRETGRTTDTINEILSLSKLESETIALRKEPVEVADFAQDCLMPFEGAVRAKGLDVQLDLAEGAIMADPNLFDHALSNVLGNAVRHASCRMVVSYNGKRLAVFNDGGTPDPALLPLLFDRFRAGDAGSTGIGLAIAKEVAHLHGWSISARALEDGLEVAFTF